MPRLSPALLLALSWLAPVSAADARQPDEAAIAFFETSVRPVLIDHCWDCHNQDVQESGLRLDSLQAMIDGGERGPAIKPGSSKESLMILAINHGETLQMPEGDKLSSEQIAALSKWVDMGAPWPNAPPISLSSDRNGDSMEFTDRQKSFWSYQRPTLPPLPGVEHRLWPRAGIDFFVLKRLEEHGLSPAGPATKRQLIRRAYFDLIGLPPTPEEIHRFFTDDSPNAFERVVDRLLASPQYGERWGRHWLDIARYADSNGLDENVAFQFIYKYRDWVIQSLNQDSPYDQFVVEQLAGDLIPQQEHETQQDYIQRVKAVGFLSVGPKMIADDDPQKKKMDLIDEQLNTVGQAFMGLTLGCARCHDHKFDPISSYDYYAMAGIFKSTKTLEHLNVVAPILKHEFKPPGFAQDLKQYEHEKQQLTERVERFLDESAEPFLQQQRARLREYVTAAIQWGVFGPLPSVGKDFIREAEDYQRGEANKEQQDGITVLRERSNVEYEFRIPEDGRYRLYFRYAAKEERDFRWTIDDLPFTRHKPWQVANSAKPAAQRWIPEKEIPLAAGPHRLQINNVRIQLDKWALVRIDSNKPIETTWSERIKTLAKTRQLDQQILQQWTLYLLKHQAEDGSIWSQLGEIASRPSSDAACEQLLDQLASQFDEAGPEDGGNRPLHEILYSKTGPFRRPDDFERRLDSDQKHHLADLRNQLKRLDDAKPTPEYVMAVKDGKPEDLPVMLRGNYLTPGMATKRAFLRIIGSQTKPIEGEQSGRLELARWITQPDHPLTPRVIVNRIWRWRFGRGIVSTTDNFGLLGELPSHPQLLDWLAVKFVNEDGWSLKKLHKRMLLSATYQMSSTLSEASVEIDPENRWLWRFPRRRLEAEPIRDAMLAVSNQLDTTMYGSLMSFKDRAYVTGTASKVTQYENNRRTVYQPVYRSAVYDVLTAFDFPDPATLSGDRQTSIVAPQALLLMNSSLVDKATLSMAERLAADRSTDQERLQLLYECLFGRLPKPNEQIAVLDTLAKLRDSTRGEESSETESWQGICRALMATNEFIHIE